MRIAHDLHLPINICHSDEKIYHTYPIVHNIRKDPKEVHRMACGKCAPKGGDKDKKKDEKKKK